MAYDERLAARVRALVEDRPGFTERRMFGGIGFMLGGNMCVGVHGDSLIVRFDVDDEREVLAREDARPFDITGRPMAGWVLVDPPGTRTAAGLGEWVDRAVAFNATLPAKAPGAGGSRMRKRSPG